MKTSNSIFSMLWHCKIGAFLGHSVISDVKRCTNIQGSLKYQDYKISISYYQTGGTIPFPMHQLQIKAHWGFLWLIQKGDKCFLAKRD